jgi:hypothetical protein
MFWQAHPKRPRQPFSKAILEALETEQKSKKNEEILKRL